MKKLFLLILIMLFATVILVAQDEKKVSEAESYKVPAPLNDEIMNWLIGEWQGKMTTPMGETNEWIKYEYTLNNQFIMMTGTATNDQMAYEGNGAISLKPNSKEAMGYWIDNMRGMYKGKGSRDNDMLKMTWYGEAGSTTRIIKKLGSNKFMLISQSPGEDGKIFEGKGEFTRLKDLTSDE